MNREQEMRKILSGEPVEIPESLLPENMKQRLLEIEEGMPPNRKVHKRGQNVRSFVHAAVAVAAGVAICVCSSYLKPPEGASLSRKGSSDEIANRQEVAAVDEQVEPVEDGYELAFASLTQMRKDGMKDRIINGLASGAIWGDDIQTGRFEEVAVDGYGFMADAETSDTAETSVKKEQSNTTTAERSDKSFSDTNVRTQGVNEGDIVKTDGDYIYEYRENAASSQDQSVCNIYKVNGADVEHVAGIEEKELDNNIFLQDMYVSDDRLILVGQLWTQNKKDVKRLYKKAGADFSTFREDTWKQDKDVEGFYANYSIVYIYDISDRSRPTLKKMTFQDGGYFTSRMVEDVLYVFSRRDMSLHGIKSVVPETYVPQINGCCVVESKVCVPKDVHTRSYSVISSIDVQDGETIDQSSILAGGSELYVSNGNIYLLDEAADRKTIITKFSYKEGKIKKMATGKVKGIVDDDYALDEYEGYLRLVTTYYSKNKTFNALYVLDENMKVTGSIKKIAEDERVYSARFMGDTAYFVTFRETDPLFTADLSDPENPKIIGKLKLPGYSDYLHPIGDHLLLGLGEEGDEEGDLEGLKLSLYDISDPEKVKEIHKLVLPEKYEYSTATENANALFIDEERGLIGFAAEGFDYDSDYSVRKTYNDYFVYSFHEKTGFKKQLKAPLGVIKDSWSEEMTQGRGLYIDDIFYVVSVGGNQIESFDFRTFQKKKKNTF